MSNLLPYFMSTSVLALYEKSGGKGGKHAWTSKATSIGALSYIVVQCYEHIQSRQSPYRFRLMECATRTRCFNLLPALAFLCMVPADSLECMPLREIIKIQSGPFSDTFRALLSEQEAVLASARVLLGTTHRRQLASDVVIERDGE